MFRKSLVIVIAVVILLGLSVKSYALVPHLINYQGKLYNGPIPLNGTFTMTFRIYDAATGGTNIWEEAREIEVKKGIFNVTLGEVAPLDLLFDQDYWLGVQIWPDPEMTPRQRIVSVGYSYMAEDSYFLAGHAPGPGNGLDADTVDGAHVADLEESAETDSKITTHKADPEAHHTKTTSFSELTDTVTDDQIPNDITIEHATTAESATTAGDADTVDGRHADELLDTSANTQNKSGGLNIAGNLGIGTSTPNYKLDVAGTINAETVKLTQLSTPPTGKLGSLYVSSSGILYFHNGIEWQRVLVTHDIKTMQKMYGGSSNDRAYSIHQTNDGGYIVAGTSSSTDIPDVTNNGNIDSYVIKLDTDGNVQWQKMYGGSFYDEAYSIKQTNDGGYIVAGNSLSIDIPDVPRNGSDDYYVLKLNLNGNL